LSDLRLLAAPPANALFSFLSCCLVSAGRVALIYQSFSGVAPQLIRLKMGTTGVFVRRIVADNLVPRIFGNHQGDGGRVAALPAIGSSWLAGATPRRDRAPSRGLVSYPSREGGSCRSLNETVWAGLSVTGGPAPSFREIVYLFHEHIAVISISYTAINCNRV